MFTLINIIVYAALMALSVYLDNPSPVLLYVLAVLLPSLAVTVRRLHDSANSGAWLWISVIPLIGPIALFVLTVLPGTVGPNEYGPDPKPAPAFV